VETEIGPTLREARIRHKIDLTEIEDQTKIRVRYLRALENEEWDLLPGPTYTRSFIRTYALALGLDGERLADDYRRQQEDQLAEPGAGREPPALPPLAPAREGSWLGPGLIGAAVVAALILLLVVIGGGDDDNNARSQGKAVNGGAKQGKGQRSAAAQQQQKVSIQLTATSEVWVCAIAADGSTVVNGEILPPGTQRGPFRSKQFDLAFGNGAVDLDVGGKPFQVEDTPSPVGYRVTPKKVRALPEGSRPDCT
jgi:cytoskeleton protein RodZ